MSTSSTTSLALTKTTRKVTKKSTFKSSKSHNVEDAITVDFNNSIIDGVDGSCVENASSPVKVNKKKFPGVGTTSSVSSSTTTKTKISANIKEQAEILQNENVASVECNQEIATAKGKKKAKSKKSRKGETDHENISVKSSFSKFDALQKRNLIHVRSSDAGKAQKKFSNPQCDKEINCHLCSKPVYKMEEIKAEKSIYHKNCFRCRECNRQLKVDNYQSHEGVLYCMVHFKLLFCPKCVEDSETDSPSKPELIVRENQPLELPPDVVRASDKPNLGLEELRQFNVRSKFQVFENAAGQEQEKYREERSPVKHTNSILSKIAKLKAQGISSDLSLKAIGDKQINSVSDYSPKGNSDVSDAEIEENISDAEVEENMSEDYDADLVRSKKRTQRERPVGLGHAMYDIKMRFEKGHMMSKEERREERKHEIQNIRSRLFMGKQARIKEMYQQAVAESEQGITASDKKLVIEHEGAARSLKERFEKGEVFKNSRDNSEDSATYHKALQNEDVFESAISKKSRSIFMELDANVVANRKNFNSPKSLQVDKLHVYNARGQNSENENEDIVKYDEKPEDIKIETSEISSKFKFFETYRPTEQKRKEFRITPPREGVVKMPTPESEIEYSNDTDKREEETHVLEKSHTTAMILNKFREIEQNSSGQKAVPRPLKCFTPPLDDGICVYDDDNSTDVESQDENEDLEEEDDDEDYYSSSRNYKCSLDDEALKEAKTAARAKQLRVKFEKWEANEKERELNEGRIDIYSNEVSDNSNIESTKIIRERFENMKNSTQTTQQARPRYQVNRFVVNKLKTQKIKHQSIETAELGSC
ncbi:LIM domain and actin-binding protein 1 isoform X2 [Bactrocera neohumeralis]|uniref:LIM domain and actin-binding protein 1 isoform X2 n=2 Tax=Bactrocera neohumeralis TaxID=98809 RepID=UPI0021659922|nr:LIM domain and actin-binding protein 1 isoform X2 [Bactrocera neohumeralis]